jgi:hypothetical protein
MSAGGQAAAPTLTTSLFGGLPTETSTASQGSIYLYQSNNCSSRLSDTATPLLLGECLNMPINGIEAVEINSLPSCSDNGTPLLLVSDQLDCKNSTQGSTADSGETLKCLAFGGGEIEVDIGSVVFSCFGNGISSVAPSAAASTNAPAPTMDSGNSGNPDSSSSSSDSSCCDSCQHCCCIFGIVLGVIAVLGAVLGGVGWCIGNS